MAFKKYSRARKYKKRRNYRRNRSAKKGYVMRYSKRIPNLGYLFPTKLRMKHPYYETDGRALGGVLYNNANWVLRGSGLQDPLVSGPGGSGGHQPMLFDTLTGVYNRYLVRGCKITIDCHTNNTSAGSGNWQVFLYPNNSSTHIYTTLGNYLPMKEADKMKWRIVPAAYTQNYKDRMVKSYRSLKSMYQGDISSRDYQGSSSANPTYEWYWNITIVPEDESSTFTAASFVDIKLVYYVEWSELLPTGTS